MSAVQINIDKVIAEFCDLLDGQWTAPLRHAGVEYTTQFVRGDPATELLPAAERADASMLVPVAPPTKRATPRTVAADRRSK